MWMDDDNFETLNEWKEEEDEEEEEEEEEDEEEEEEGVSDDDDDWRQPSHVSNLFVS
jgi:hypothetical protein